MVNFNFVIRDELGIHARPAGQLAKLAKSFAPANVTITKGDKTVKASQLMKLMSLAVKQGDEVTVTVEGENEVDAAAALLAYFEKEL